MRMKRLLMVLLIAVFSFSFTATGARAADLVKLPTAWMDEHETFLIWYAKEKGWDKAEGLDIDVQYFSSGMDILNALPSGSWVFAGMGGVPAMMGNLRYGTSVIAIGNDESMTNAVLVRADSPIAKVKGWNKDYPEVYGSPETIKGKTFLTTTVSSAHYALSSWLKVFGLTDADVTIKNMDQAQALAAFDNSIGDGVALWAPHMYAGEAKGWKIAGDLQKCKVGNPIVLIADTKYAEANPEVVAKFLRVYLRSVNMMQKEPLENLIADYQRFFLEWAGKNYTKQLCLTDMKTHPVFNLEQQLALFDDSKGASTAQQWQAAIAKFFNSVGSINNDELAKVGSGTYATGKYLKLITGPIPGYK